MTNITIRPIREKDNRPMAQIIRRCFEEFRAPREGTVYSDRATDILYQTFRDNPGAGYLVLEEETASGEKTLLGGCGFYPTAGLPDGYAELVKFYLRPSARGKGYGKRLIVEVLEKMALSGYEYAYIESFPEFGTAVALYEKMGFRHLDRALGNSGHYACTVHMVKKL